MSLILDALRKLDRERANPERGFAVLGPQAWRAEGDRGRVLAFLGAGIAGLAVLAGALAWVSTRPSRPGEGAPEARAGGQAPTTPAASPPAPRLAAFPSAPPASPPPAKVAASPAAPPTPAPEEGKLAARDELPPSRFVLTAIGARDGQPVAVLNDRLVRAGDEFDGVRIVRIGAAEVEIEVGGVRRVVGF